MSQSAIRLLYYAALTFKPPQPKEYMSKWILNNYTLSCGITREEVDEKIAELR